MGLLSSKKSKTSTTTTNTFNDNREVNDAGGGLVGDGNVITSTDGGAFELVGNVAQLQLDATRSIADAGRGTTDSAFAFAERAQADAASFNDSAARRVFDLASSSQARAFDSSGEALGFARETFGDVLGLARNVVGQAGEQAREASTVAAGAYSSAADSGTGNRTLAYAGLAVVAVLALPMIFRKG